MICDQLEETNGENILSLVQESSEGLLDDSHFADSAGIATKAPDKKDVASTILKMTTTPLKTTISNGSQSTLTTSTISNSNITTVTVAPALLLVNENSNVSSVTIETCDLEGSKLKNTVNLEGKNIFY